MNDCQLLPTLLHGNGHGAKGFFIGTNGEVQEKPYKSYLGTKEVGDCLWPANVHVA